MSDTPRVAEERRMSRVSGDEEDDDFTPNSCSDPRYATGCKEVKIANAMRTGRDADHIWRSMNKSHVVHVNHSTLHWRLR